MSCFQYPIYKDIFCIHIDVMCDYLYAYKDRGTYIQHKHIYKHMYRTSVEKPNFQNKACIVLLMINFDSICPFQNSHCYQHFYPSFRTLLRVFIARIIFYKGFSSTIFTVWYSQSFSVNFMLQILKNLLVSNTE